MYKCSNRKASNGPLCSICAIDSTQAVTTVSIPDTTYGKDLSHKPRTIPRKSHWRYPFEINVSTRIILIMLGIYNPAPFALDNNESFLTTFDYPQLNSLTSKSSVRPSSQSLVSCRKD